MKKLYKFYLPLYIDIPRKTKTDKRVYLNLNVYRNLHHMINNKAKKLFSPIGEKFEAKKIKIRYSVMRSSKRKYDVMNVISVVDKFFLDWLVDNGCIKDDTFDVVSYGEIVGSNCNKDDTILALIEVIE